MQPYKQLKSIFKRIYHLQNVQHILIWDESVMMPEGASKTRAKVMGTLNRITQKMLRQKKIETLIALTEKDNTLSSWDNANVNWMKKQHKITSSIPPKLAEKFTETSLLSQQMWRKLRVQNNWNDFLPFLEKTFYLVKELAERKSQVMDLHPYDVLLDEYAPGFDQAFIDSIFTGLKKQLPTLIKQIATQQNIDKIKIPVGPFQIKKQKRVAAVIAKALGFKFSNGRIDVSHHPFCCGDRNDTRITNRYIKDNFLSSLFGICHETGHALYEQGLPKKWQFQPVGHVNNMAMHESQSLLMEMEICRSLEFFKYISPMLKNEFGEQEALNAGNLYKVMARVKPSLIRVDADEVTYPLHIILRYEIEKELLNGEILVSDLPTRWNELMIRYLGISTENNYVDGVMQDVHWPSGAFGYFPAYTLGRIIAAQIYSTFIHAHPDFLFDVKKGQFQLINQWLQKNVYDVASLLPTNILIKNITKESLNSNYFIELIKRRYLGAEKTTDSNN